MPAAVWYSCVYSYFSFLFLERLGYLFLLHIQDCLCPCFSALPSAFSQEQFCSSYNIRSVLKPVSKSQRAVLNAVVWPKMYWYDRISGHKKGGEKKNSGEKKKTELRILKIEEM